MDANFFSQLSNATLIQGATLIDLESMISRLLDKKLSEVLESIPGVEDHKSPSDGLYKRREAAEKLRVSLVTLDAWTKAGIINVRRIGGRIYYTEKDINDALKKASK